MEIKRNYNSELRQLHDLTPTRKYFEEKIHLQFSNSVLVVEQNSYAVKFVNNYISYELGNWQGNLHNNFTLKYFLFSATNIVKIRDNGKYDLSYRICIPNKTADINVNVLDITRINESKALTKHVSWECECRFNYRKYYSNQKWNNKCWVQKSKKACVWKKLCLESWYMYLWK